jgi:DNA-binding transcriptional LysR family regulator
LLKLHGPPTQANLAAAACQIGTAYSLPSDHYLDLAKGEADIAIRAGQSPDENLVGRKIGETRWAVYASRSYVERHGRAQRTEDIERHFVVVMDGGLKNYRAAQWLRSIAPHATIAARCDSWPGLVLAVKSGAGLTPDAGRRRRPRQ